MKGGERQEGEWPGLIWSYVGSCSVVCSKEGKYSFLFAVLGVKNRHLAMPGTY